MRHQSEKTKRRAALAALLSLLAFTFCLFGLVGSDRAIRTRNEHAWASERVRSFRRELGQAPTREAQQAIIQKMVQPDGALAAAVVVGRDRKIRAAMPARADLVDRPVTQGPWEGLMGDQELRFRLREVLAAAPAIGRAAFDHSLIGETLTNEQGDHVGWIFALAKSERPAVSRLAEVIAPIAGIGALVSFTLYWFMLPLWVYLDARPRTNKAFPLALFVFLTNFLGWLTYLVIRPESDRICPGCDAPLEPGFRLCPMCGWSNSLRCHHCSRPTHPDWRFCPHCETPRPT